MSAAGRPSRPSRPPRRDGANRSRPAPSGRSGRRAEGDRAERTDRSDGRRSSGPPSRGRRPPPTGRSRGTRPEPTTKTAAQRRAAEVNARRGRRTPPDPEAERAKIEGRTLETWIDEGALRDEAAGAANRAATAPHPAPRRPRSPAIGERTAAAIVAESGDARQAAILTDRLRQAQEALDRERFDDARRLASGLLRQLPNVAAVHEVLGLAAYRSGRWRQAVNELEKAQALEPSIELLPVLADAYRALERWSDVERVWADVRAASPAQETLAEARIVAAGAQADQGDLSGALRTMHKATEVPRRVRDHHLRQWYVLGDLHDRSGDQLEAARWFELVAEHDPDFVDVRERLRLLGR